MADSNSGKGKMYKIGDLLDTSNNGLTRLQQANIIISYILEKEQCFSPTNPMKTPAIQEKYNEIKKNHPNVFDIKLGTLAAYMSILANDADSKISCDGKKQGYYLNIVNTNVIKENDINKRA